MDDPFLQLEVDNSNERGLGKMVLHPDFETNGYYYVYYTVPGIRANRVSRFTANGNYTIPGSEKVIIDMDRVGADVHNGGAMVFGFDGFLYIATGDGNQPWRGEDLGSTNAKILKIDADGNPAPDNPYKDLNYLRCAYVYASGFRNPFTAALHPLTGDIYVNDVGGVSWEEINKVEKGKFYGWPKLEGFRTSQEVPDEYQDPEYAYLHVNGYCCIVGSTFYIPPVPQFPVDYEGVYFYSDYCTGHIRMMDPQTKEDKGIFMTGGNRVIDMKVGLKGELYYLERRGLKDGSHEDNTGTEDGILWKIEYTGTGIPFIAIHPEDQLVAEGEFATFSITASGTTPLVYKWFVDGEVYVEGDVTEITIGPASLDQDSLEISVEINNVNGQITSDVAYLLVTPNKRPQPQILTPAEGSTYKAGDKIQFSGVATDPEEGQLNPERMSWRIDFHHGTHSHPSMPWTSGIDAGEYVIPTLGETATNVWYRIHFNVHDSEGLLKSVYRDITPELGQISVFTEPAGLSIGLDGVSTVTPFKIEGVNGVVRYITPPVKQNDGPYLYFFKEWQDGSKILNRDVQCSQQDQTFVGIFDRTRRGQGSGLSTYYYDNVSFSGEPVEKSIDSVIYHQYHLQSPSPNIPIDNFSIVWKGYILPQVTGVHEFNLFADDLVYLSIDNTQLINDEEAGPGNHTAYKYLEKGQLYPIEIRLVEFSWSAFIDFRWKTDFFPEERVPGFQLFPEDYISSPGVFSLVNAKTIGTSQFELEFESYLESPINLEVMSIDGKLVRRFSHEVIPGRNKYQIDLQNLVPGIYIIRGMRNQELVFSKKVDVVK